MCQGQCHVHCATTWQGGGMICELCVSKTLVTTIPRTGQHLQPRFPSLTIADEDMARYAHITTEVGRSAIQGAQLGGMLLGGATTAVVQGGVRLVSAAMSQGRDILRQPVSTTATPEMITPGTPPRISGGVVTRPEHLPPLPAVQEASDNGMARIVEQAREQERQQTAELRDELQQLMQQMRREADQLSRERQEQQRRNAGASSPEGSQQFPSDTSFQVVSPRPATPSQVNEPHEPPGLSLQEDEAGDNQFH